MTMTAPAPAPELAGALNWVNADPLRLQDLRGRVVVLWFWHAGSALSHNVLEQLRYLQAHHGGNVCVVGVHVPRFDAERDPRAVLKAVNRLGIRFPVAADPDFIAWQHFGVSGWPSTVLVDARGRVRKTITGDGPGDELRQSVARLVDGPGEPDAASLDEPFRSLLHAEPRQALAFPSGLACSETHLYVSDTAHHRVLECTHDGRVLRQFGSGAAGFLDGDAGEACFQSPRGIAVWNDALYVADTGNHALRRVQLAHGDVDTLAGNGRAGRVGPDPDAQGPAALRLNAPWDVAADGDRLYIAMAGTRQVWQFDPAGRCLELVAGCGLPGVADGPAAQACFGQPAALALVQRTLYVADSTASAIRSVHLGDGGGVQTLVGQDLFGFGDCDGTRSAARLQAPAGLALDARAPILWIADTCNNGLKMLRLGGGDVRRFEVDYRLHEPTALAAAEGVLWLANSAAHEILRIDIGAGAVRRLPVGE
jgi:sugar lactone lactonase YvrE